MGMAMRILRKNAREDDEPSEKRRVPYKLASYEHDHEGKKIRSSKIVFSFWSASKYVFILSLMLWWLPMFGQMIAGYVGGRRAGSPWRGVAASIFPVVAIYGVVAGFSTGLLPTHIFGMPIEPTMIAAAMNTNIPFLSPYLHFSSEYVGAFVSALSGVSPYGINTYVLTVAFAYVGGVLAEQNRREIEYNSGATTTHTTVLVHDPSAYGQQATHPWLSSMGSFLHLPQGHADATGAMARSSRGRGEWASAQEGEYDENVLELDESESGADGEARVYAARTHGFHRSKHHHKGHGYPPHHVDPWNGKHQKRSGAPNYSAKPRFRYQQYEQPGQRNRQFRQDSRHFPKFTVSPDPKSIRRAEKLIDDEWGNKKFSRFSEVHDRNGRESSDETEAVAVAKPREQHHRPMNQWDQI